MLSESPTAPIATLTIKHPLQHPTLSENNMCANKIVKRIY